MPTRTVCLVATIAVAGGCTDLDHEVVPDVVEAHVAVDRDAPDQLATVDVVVALVAGSRADRVVDLWDAALLEPILDRPGLELELAMQGGSVALDPGDEVRVDLVNVGTTNADLMPGCFRAYDVSVTIRYLADPMMNGFGDADLARVTIDCD